MKNKNSVTEIVDIILTTISNIVWFAVWLYIIFGLHNSGWWILVPMFFNFKTDRAIEAIHKK